MNFTFGLGSEHAQDSPDLALACFALPNPSNAIGSPGTGEPMVIRFPYINGGPLTNATRQATTGTGQNYYSATEYPGTTNKTVLTTFGQTGTVYGVAYDKRRNRLLTSAYERAYTGIGPDGAGGTGKLYTTTFNANGSAASTSLWLDLESALSAGVTGTDPAITPGLTFVSSTPTTISRFEHNKIGHISLGDLEFSADGKTVFVVNLFSRQIYGIPVNANGTPNTGSIRTYTPTNPCASGSFTDPATPAGARPYNVLLGLGVHPETGRIYCAVTCSGPAASNLKGYIYSFDPTAATTTFTEELQIPLNISFQSGGDGTEGTYATTTNEAWSPTANNTDVTNNYSDHAWMADIVFDIEPNGTTYMVVGGRNRFMDATSGSRITHGQGLWLSAPNGSGWSLESDGVAGGRTTANVLTQAWFAARDGNGVFFNTHGSEGTNGTGNIIAIPGFAELALGAVDNVKSAGNSGLMFMNRSNGARTRDILLLGSLTAGGTPPRGEVYKANLWGEVEALLEPAPLEVGNYVFVDVNKNGLQDPSDLPIAGVTVKLVEDTNGDGLPNETAVASTTTDASGLYYFDQTDGLKYDTKYVLVINQSTDFTTGALSGLRATMANVGANSKDTRDSDGELLGTNQYVKTAFETGGPGESRHNYDFGFIEFSCSLTATAQASSQTITAGQSVTLTAQVTPAGSYTYVWGGAGTITPTNASTAIVSGLVTGEHTFTVTVSNSPDCFTTATVSVTVLPAPCSLAMLVTPGLCLSATNTYVLSTSVTATNVTTSGTLTLSSSAFASRTQVLPAGNASGTFSYSGLISNGQTYTVTASYSDSVCPAVSQTYAAPASCSVAPVCSLSASATASICATATNTYSASVVIALANAPAGTITIDLPGSAPVSQTLAANTPSFTAIFQNLPSDGISHTATISLPGCGTTTASFTAPASCSVAPICSLSAVATAGLCQSATNTYTSTVVVTQTNSTMGVLTITDGPASQTFTTTAVSVASFTATFTNVPSDGSIHKVTASLPDCSSTTTTYTAPASCSVAPVCSLSATATAGLCATATNTYSATVVIGLVNAPAGTLTISIPGSTPISQTLAANAGSVTIVLPGLLSDGATHTATISLPGCGSTTAVFTAPASCTVAPVCSISAVVTAGLCTTTTNSYSATAVVTVTNPVAGGTVSVSTGGQTLTFSTTAISQNTFTANFNGLLSDGASHVVTVSLPGCGSANTTYTAPASCSVAPVCSISAVATAGICATATNTSSTTVLVTMTNPTAGTLTVTDGVRSITFVVQASPGTTVAPAIFNGIPSDGSSHTVTVSLPGCSSATLTYTAPVSCSVATPLASLGDYVWLDTNKDGIQDGTETGVANVTAVLCDATSGTVISTTLTDGSGKYLFTNLNPGSYIIKFTAPTGTTFTTSNLGPDAADSDVASTTGSKGSTGVYSLTAGEQNLTVDAGLIPLPGSIGDFVWNDLNKNGQQDSGEPGVDGVTIRLLQQTTPGNFTVVSTTVTTGGGTYLFPNLPAGTYVVEFVISTLPANFTLTMVTASGVSTAQDSDANPTTGRSGLIELVPTNPAQRNILTIDAGIIDTECPPAKCVPIVVRRTR